jgi:hypothetical protein
MHSTVTALLCIHACVAIYSQVFRTYNASITLDRLLSEMEEAEDAYADKTVDAKKADYDRANKEVRAC